MDRKYRTFETAEYKFIDFSDILKDIRDSFFDDIENDFGDINLEDLPQRTKNKYLRHSAILQILKTYSYVDYTKTFNAILITRDISVNCAGLYDAEKFLENVLVSINKSKRTIPILIKKIDCDFDGIGDFLKTGDGKEFISQLDLDKEKLRKNACSFQEFKIFARNNGLKYILEEIIDKKEFKRLIVS